jgi:hypothetical protein
MRQLKPKRHLKYIKKRLKMQVKKAMIYNKGVTFMKWDYVKVLNKAIDFMKVWMEVRN